MWREICILADMSSDYGMSGRQGVVCAVPSVSLYVRGLLCVTVYRGSGNKHHCVSVSPDSYKQFMPLCCHVAGCCVGTCCCDLCVPCVRALPCTRGLMGPLHRLPVKSLEPMDGALFGKKVFAGLLKLRVLRSEDHLGLSRRALNPVTSFLVRERYDTEGDVTPGAETE